MCSICGILGGSGLESEKIIKEMNATMKNRGPDQSGIFSDGDIHLAHNRLAIIDVENGRQPMTRIYGGVSYTIVYNGEIYNTAELTEIIKSRGITPETYCDTEVVLWLYILFGEKCAEMLNGIFAFAVFNGRTKEVCLVRDRFGIKPLFYAFDGKTMIFASEIKAILKYPSIKPIVDEKGIWQLIFLTPVRLTGGIFRNVSELEPAHYGIWRDGTFKKRRYWELKAAVCTESRDEVIAHTRFLLTDAIERQLVSDVPLCTLLSGGLDSTVISGVAARCLKERGEELSTYSFEYEGNRESFHSSLFQPQSDDDYARFAAEFLGTEHHILTASTEDVVNALKPAAAARDFPGQADIDSSLYYFCSLIKKNHTVALSGECADEIFGGYPWFYRPEMLESPFFPWIHDHMIRAKLFNEEFERPNEGYEYISGEYQRSMAECPVLENDSDSMKTSRRATWLSVNYFMASLLERKDRMSMASSVEVRVPFADHRILEYVFNVPWEIKFENGVEKALLRNAMRDYIPEKVFSRKKSPYPKTQNPAYEQAVLNRVRERLQDSGSVLHNILNFKAFNSFINGENETWFGQLMAKPQLLAWLIQLDYWADAYNVEYKA